MHIYKGIGERRLDILVTPDPTTQPTSEPCYYCGQEATLQGGLREVLVESRGARVHRLAYQYIRNEVKDIVKPVPLCDEEHCQRRRLEELRVAFTASNYFGDDHEFLTSYEIKRRLLHFDRRTIRWFLGELMFNF